MDEQLAVLIGIYAFVGLPLWLTPIAHLVEFIRARTRKDIRDTPAA